QVSFTPAGGSSVTVTATSYVGNTWKGTGKITETMNHGAAVLTMAGARDTAGRTISKSLFSFQIGIERPAAPTHLSVSLKAELGSLEIAWQPASGSSPVSYNLYRSTGPISKHPTPIIKGITETSAQDVPPPDFPQIYYGVTAFDSQGVESVVSDTVSVA